MIGGLWVGFPVPFPYGYAYPYLGYPYYYFYPYGYPYGTAAGLPPSEDDITPPAEGVQVESNGGGLSFDITPPDAHVYVDGTYYGHASNFGARSLPLTIKAGTHHIELRAEGYQTMAFDADVVAGQVIPYQGRMQPMP